MWLSLGLMLSRARAQQSATCQICKLRLSLNRESQSHFGILAYFNALFSVYRCERNLVHFQLGKTKEREVRKTLTSINYIV